MTTDDRKEIEILQEDDIVAARSAGREIAQALGFRLVDCTQVATAISELARNIILYAGQGTITINIVRNSESPKEPNARELAQFNGIGFEALRRISRPRKPSFVSHFERAIACDLLTC